MSPAPARSPAPEGPRADVGVAYGRALMRASTVYAVGVGALIPLGLVSLAVTTRYLDPSDYGRVAILFAAASILTILANIGVLQGTLMLVYRGGDEDDDGGTDVTDEDLADVPDPGADERKRLLGSGLLLSVVVGAVLTVPLALLVAGPIAELLLGSEKWTRAVEWMLMSVWAGSVWRLAQQIWRYERRPGAWLFHQVLRPTVVIALTAGALAAGYGVEGVMAATALGTVATGAVGIVAARRTFTLRPRLQDGPTIYREGLRLAPMIVASVSQTYISLFVVAALTSAETAGIYQVALRLAMIPAYFGDGIFLGWPTLARGPIGTAATVQRGRAAQNAAVFTVMATSMLALAVLVSLSVGLLVRVAASDYADAATLVPVLSAAAVSHVLFRAVYRTSRFPRRRTWYVVLHYVWALPYAAVLALVAPSHPTWAVGIAQIVAYALMIGAMLVVQARRSSDPTPYPWRRLGAGLLACVACVGAVEAASVDGLAHVAVSVAAVALLPFALIVLGAARASELRAAAQIVLGIAPSRMSRRALRRGLAAVRPGQARILAALAWDGEDPDAVAAREGLARDVVLARYVRALRAFSRTGGRDGPEDAEIGRYLLGAGTVLERDAVARRLAARGVDQHELHELQSTAAAARRARRRRPTPPVASPGERAGATP